MGHFLTIRFVNDCKWDLLAVFNEPQQMREMMMMIFFDDDFN